MYVFSLKIIHSENVQTIAIPLSLTGKIPFVFSVQSEQIYIYEV